MADRAKVTKKANVQQHERVRESEVRLCFQFVRGLERETVSSHPHEETCRLGVERALAQQQLIDR